jgi:hypothetical protein
MKKILWVLLVITTAAIADGAPYCVSAPGLSLQCWYFDVASCQRAAQAARGLCVPNPDTR